MSYFLVLLSTNDFFSFAYILTRLNQRYVLCFFYILWPWDVANIVYLYFRKSSGDKP